MTVLPGDYRAILYLKILIGLQDRGNEEYFANGLLTFWDRIDNEIPNEVKTNPAYLILDIYFRNRGNLREPMPYLIDVIEKIYGVKHAGYMERVEAATHLGSALFDRVREVRRGK